MSLMLRPRLGISSCLLGSNVRYDGGHKRNAFLLETLGTYVDWVSACPEVDIGLGTPRPPIQLENEGARGLRLVVPETGEDLTDRMTSYAERRVTAARTDRLAGYVLKSRSPSCGMERVPVHDGKRDASPVGVGLFAAVLIRHMPHLPVEEEGRLDDPCLRENFITRIFARARWLELEEAGTTIRALAGFHTRHKYLLMSRDPNAVETLDHLLGEADDGRTEESELTAKYERRFSEALSRPPDRENQANVLRQMAGCLSDEIEAEDRAQLGESIDAYQAGDMPLAIPVTVLRQLVRKNDVKVLADQVYLEPHPEGLKLLYHV